MRKVYFATLPNGYFGSAINSWNTLDVRRLAAPFLAKEYDVSYVLITDIKNIQFKKDDVLIYTSFEQEEVRAYLKDILYFVKDQCLLAPSYEILLAHENKGFQESIRKQKNIDNLSSQYLFDIDQLEINFPYVFKTIGGSGSSGVELVKHVNDLEKIKKNHFGLSTKRRIKNIIRQYQLPKENYLLYRYYYKPFKRFVTQRFIENLTCDYRVLVIGDRFYAMRRDVREGDFRASGSKKFNYHDVPSVVLDFAKEIFNKLDNPYISMDLALQHDQVYLIEYQGTNFGSSALRKSNGYYVQRDQEWCFIDEISQHEDTLGYGLLTFVEKKYA
ncbi:ATP-grasp domain-containing protein [Acinetobacter haemolyticus]|uniref:ATP-grasp domain-containing protein n=1 Tax=Acinetobacter haemolyticus TaxID=29430 RepID=UPI00031587CD|nr:hypothetical protein [Acinetobacter haemolyticus]